MALSLLQLLNLVIVTGSTVAALRAPPLTPAVSLPNVTLNGLTFNLDASQRINLLAPSTGSFAFFNANSKHFGFGDVTFEIRTISSDDIGGGAKSQQPWVGFQTSTKNVTAVSNPSAPIIAAADLSASLLPWTPVSVGPPSSSYQAPNTSSTSTAVVKEEPNSNRGVHHVAAAAPSNITIKRQWEIGKLAHRPHQHGHGNDGTSNQALVLRFVVENLDPTHSVEIGSFGLPLQFPFAAGSPAGDKASTFLDPAINGEHGYATVTRLSGYDEILMITTPTPTDGGVSRRTSLEAWRIPKELPGGGVEWLCLSKSIASNWTSGGSGKQWIEPSSRTLGPAGTKTATIEFAFVFSLAKTMTAKQLSLTLANVSVVRSVPGYILAQDMTTAQALVRPPADVTLVSATTDSPDSLNVGKIAPVSESGWYSIPLTATADDHPRLTLTFSDGSTQVVNYRTLPPFDQHVDKYGTFQAEVAFFDPVVADKFQRSPSVMPWDRELHQHVLDDPRNFIVGLSDDAGAGANSGFASKNWKRPVRAEIAKLDSYIHHTLWGEAADGAGILVSLQDHTSYGVRSSMFWTPQTNTNETGMPGYDYLPEDSQGWIWDRNRAASLGRAYNYPHQTAVYFAMYSALHNNAGLKATMPSAWYLQQAANTIVGMWHNARWYSQQGLMAGTVFKHVLEALEAHNNNDDNNDGDILTALTTTVRDIMYNRTMVGVTVGSASSCLHGACQCFNCSQPWSPHSNGSDVCPTEQQLKEGHRSIVYYNCLAWVYNPFPFGSEFAWDSTGQEEEYVWGRYFGTVAHPSERSSTQKGSPKGDALADLTLSAILAYLPQAPHWAYNGAAWSTGDTSNNAKWSANGRVTGHYRTSLNAIPLMEELLMDPDNWYLLEPLVGASTLHLATIDENGAASMGFHLDPAILKLDPYSGDFGVGFFGHVHLAASYYVHHPTHGPLCYLCDAIDPTSNTNVTIFARDSMRKRMFIEPLGFFLEILAGDFTSVTVNLANQSVTMHFAHDNMTDFYRLKVRTPSLKRPAAKGYRIVYPEMSLSRTNIYQFSSTTSEVVIAVNTKHATPSIKANKGKTIAVTSPASTIPPPPPTITPPRSPTTPPPQTPPPPPPRLTPSCDVVYPSTLSGYSHVGMNLCGSPDLAGFEGGVAVANVSHCAQLCATQVNSDGWRRLACQAWTFAMAEVSPTKNQGWCWLRAGRGNAIGRCGYVSSACENRPAPATPWPCCQSGYGCPDIIAANTTTC